MSKKNHPKAKITPISLGFSEDMVELSVNKIMPTKVVDSKIRSSSQYKQVVSSIKEIGVIEPPVVVANNHSKQSFILFDGHMRIAGLKELVIKETTCLISSDDESFTYNKHINRIATIQEHCMIKRAIERGVSEDKIARTLNMDVKSILNKCSLLDGICPEVVDMLNDNNTTTPTNTGDLRLSDFEHRKVVFRLMVEKTGFEPVIRYYPYTFLAGRRLQPLGHFSIHIYNDNITVLFCKGKSMFHILNCVFII